MTGFPFCILSLLNKEHERSPLPTFSTLAQPLHSTLHVSPPYPSVTLSSSPCRRVCALDRSCWSTSRDEPLGDLNTYNLLQVLRLSQQLLEPSSSVSDSKDVVNEDKKKEQVLGLQPADEQKLFDSLKEGQ